MPQQKTTDRVASMTDLFSMAVDPGRLSSRRQQAQCPARLRLAHRRPPSRCPALALVSPLMGTNPVGSGLHPHDLIYCNHPLKGSMSSTASWGLGLLRTNVAIVGVARRHGSAPITGQGSSVNTDQEVCSGSYMGTQTQDRGHQGDQSRGPAPRVSYEAGREARDTEAGEATPRP